MTRKVLSVLLCAVMLLSMFTACEQDKTSNGTDINWDAIEGLEGHLCSKTPLELTVHFHAGASGVYDEEKWSIYRQAEEWTNIYLKGTVGKDQDYTQAFNLMLLEDKLPDIIFQSVANLNNAGMSEGAMIDLKPYVTNPDIMPNLAKIYEEFPEYLVAITAPDGGVYACPKIRQAGPTQAWYTREDWMEKLNLEHPKTFEDFVAVMDAFRNQDPNGNGKKDEVPFFGPYKDLFYFFGLNGGRYWDVNKKDEFFTPMMTKDYKTALITINDWYEKGYIDQEIFTRKNPRGELWGNNVGGMTFNWFSSTMSYNNQIKNIPGFHVSVMMPPENMHGEAYCHSPGTTVSDTGWGISVDNEHVAESLKYLDFWYSDEGSLLNAMGVEGRDFEYDENGVPKYTELALNYQGGAPSYVRSIGCVDIGYYMRQKWLISGMTEEAATGLQNYVDADFTCELVPILNFTKEEQEIINNEWTACATYIDEYMQNAILGNKDVNATWDSYIAELKNLGIEKVADVYNTAYARYKKGLKNI